MRYRLLVAHVLTFLVWYPVFAENRDGLSLTPSVPSGQLAGTTVTWTADYDAPGFFVYRFSIGETGQPSRVVRAFDLAASFDWTSIDAGEYEITASVRRVQGTQLEAETTEVFSIVSPAGSGTPVVSSTSHPLVALLNAPPCTNAGVVWAEFRVETQHGWHRTSSKSCTTGQSRGFWIAGMLPETRYAMRILLDANGETSVGPTVEFTTGSVGSVGLPVFEPDVGEPGMVSDFETMVLAAPPPESDPTIPVAADLEGRILWYYDRVAQDGEKCVLTSLGQDGSMLMLVGVGGVHGQLLREIDLAGNMLRQTSVSRVNEQLVALGVADTIGAFDHEATRFSNGHTLVQGSVERIILGAQGAPPGVPVNVLGAILIALDRDWQIVWYWNAFDALDVERAAILDEQCGDQTPGCPPLFATPVANDWIHGNAVAETPDGNLIFSMRHQDWVVKIAYDNGQGDGRVLWRLGPEGDFSLASGDPWPWFSHQHGASFVDDRTLVVFDNGNTRCEASTDDCFSRGQVVRLDEAARTAELILNADLGVFSAALGMAQRLANGNYHFTAGMLPGPSHQSMETAADGDVVFALLGAVSAYRSYRLAGLYEMGGWRVFADGFESGDNLAWTVH